MRREGLGASVARVTTQATQHLAAVMEAAETVGLVLRDAEDRLIATATGAGGVVTLDFGSIAAGPFTLVITNTGARDEAFELWEVLTEQR